MTIPLQPTIFANWELLYDVELEAVRLPAPGGTSRYIPIDPVLIPFQLDNLNIAIRTENANAAPRWYLGCRVDAIFQIVQSGPNLPLSELIFHRFDARINKTTYIYLPDYSPQYQLRLDIPYWFDSLKIKLWQYIGP